MRKLLLPLLTILLFASCQKQISKEQVQQEVGFVANKEKDKKITVCHNEGNGSLHTITISASAWPAHQAHGDVLGDCSVAITTICNQVWMVKNLDVDKYRDGTTIPQATTDAEWVAAVNAGTGAWCYYANNSANRSVYGKLYNWYAVNDPRGLAPTGWHVPSDAEWTTLETCLDAISPTGNVGGKMKETGTAHWTSTNADVTNISGFTALPGGYCDSNGWFLSVGVLGIWWSSTEFPFNPRSAWIRYLCCGGISRLSGSKEAGFSVRCLRD